MDALGPCAGLEELQAARGHRQRDALRVGEPFRVEPEQLAAGERRRERADEAGGMEAALVEAALRHLRESRAALEAGDERRQHRRAAVAAARREIQRGGQDPDRQVDHARHVRVVVVEAVREHAVEQHRVAQRQAAVVPDDAGAPGRVVERRHVVEGAREVVREDFAARRERTADRVEHQVAGAQADVGRDVVQVQSVREAGQRLRDRFAGGRGLGSVHGCSLLFVRTNIRRCRETVNRRAIPRYLRSSMRYVKRSLGWMLSATCNSVPSSA